MGSSLTLVDPSVFSPYLRRIFGMVHYGRTFAYIPRAITYFPALGPHGVYSTAWSPLIHTNTSVAL